MYTVMENLARGGISTVFLVQDFFTKNILVAKKSIELRNNFMIEREFRMLRILKHENIIEMIDHVYSRNGDTIILERADETLQEYVKHNHMQALEKFDRIFYQMCSAISFTHEKGIVHRDLKPDNFLMVNSNVKLADFSHAITIQNLKENAYIGTAGNYRTRAPEVLLRLPYDESSDVWSLGFCFAFVILNTRFISGNNDAAVLTEVRTYFPPDEEVPEFQSHPPLFDDSKFKTIMGKVFDKTAMKNGSHFHDLIVECLQVNPKKRIKSCQLLDHPAFEL